MVSIQITNDKICNDLSKYNIIERKTWTYKPTLLHSKLMPHFLRGFLDGDGCITKKRKSDIPSSYKITFCGNHECMNFISNYLKSININNSVYFDKRSCKHLFSTIEIFGASDKYCFLKYLYNNATVYLERKYFLANKIINMIESNVTNRKENKKAVEFYYNNF